MGHNFLPPFNTHKHTDGCATVRSRSAGHSSYFPPAAMLASGLCPAAVAIATCDSASARSRYRGDVTEDTSERRRVAWVRVTAANAAITVLTQRGETPPLLTLLSFFCLSFHPLLDPSCFFPSFFVATARCALSVGVATLPFSVCASVCVCA